MNTKTTLYLAVAFAGLGVIFLWSPPANPPTDTPTSTAAPTSSKAATDLVDAEQDDIVKVVCTLMGKDGWVFEKRDGDTGTKIWYMTSPTEMKAMGWEVGRIIRSLTGLQSEITHHPGEPDAVSASEAGLEPPRAVVTLTSSAGESEIVEIGKPASATTHYVRIPGESDILETTKSLNGLFKARLLDYREQQLWVFSPTNATRIEFVDRTNADKEINYVFDRDGAGWIMKEPAVAKATDLVQKAVDAMGRMRVTKWEDDRPERLAAYGLKTSSVSARVTVEEEVTSPSDDDTEDATGEEGELEAPKAETKTTVYEIHLSDLSPIGEETKVYMRAADEPAVGVIMKLVADKFRPVMSKWRDMSIASPGVENATKIEISSEQGQTAFEKKDGSWKFLNSGDRAEDSAIRSLLNAIGSMKAVVFVDDAEAHLSDFGLDKPQVDIRLTVPGQAEVERISVGSFTDPNTKRLVYVRRNEGVSVAKVRTADVEALTKSFSEYRDRGIFDVAASRFESLTLSVLSRFTEDRTQTAFANHNGDWSMTSPVQADVRKDRIDALVDALGGLRATSIVADKGEPSAFGLHDPAVRISFTYKPPVEYRLEERTSNDESADNSDGTDDENSKASSDASQNNKQLVPVEFQPPSETLELLVTEHDGNTFAMKPGSPTVYGVSPSLFGQLIAEYRTGEVWKFDAANVKRFAIKTDSVTHDFSRSGEGWKYEAEPDLPLDAKKVDNLLLQIGDLKTDRYMTASPSDLTTKGLADPFRSVVLVFEDGSERMLRVSNRSFQKDASLGSYATVDANQSLFLLTADTIQRLAVSLDDLESK